MQPHASKRNFPPENTEEAACLPRWPHDARLQEVARLLALASSLLAADMSEQSSDPATREQCAGAPMVKRWSSHEHDVPRSAVASALAELQPDLIRAVSEACTQTVREMMVDGATRLGHRGHGEAQKASALGEARKAPASGWGRQVSAPVTVGWVRQKSEQSQLRSLQEGTAMSPDSSRASREGPMAFSSSRSSGRLSGILGKPSSTLRGVCSQGNLPTSETSVFSHNSRAHFKQPPTIQALQSNIAMAILEQSRVGASASRPHERAHKTQPKQQGGGLRCVRILPEAHEMDLEPLGVEDVGASSSCPADGRSDAPKGTHVSEASLASLISVEAETETCIASERPAVPVGLVKSTTAAVDGRRFSTTDQVLRTRIHELARQATDLNLDALENSEDSDATPKFRGPLVLRVCGMLPWRSAKRPWFAMAYRWVVRAVVSLAVLLFLLPNVSTAFRDTVAFIPECGVLGALCWQRDGFASQVPLPTGAVVVILPMCLKRHQEAFEDIFSLLHGVAVERGYLGWRERQGRKDTVAFLLIWSGIIVASGLGDDTAGRAVGNSVGFGILRSALIGTYTGVILCLAYGLVCVCRSLNVMIDIFCCDIVGDVQLHEVAHTWNLTQAVLRRSSNVVESWLLELCFILAVIAPLCLVDAGILDGRGAPVAVLVPSLLVACGIIYVLFLAAMISEKCASLPPLVNSMTFGMGTERTRQQIVDYITSSAAGFYVFGVRLSTAMVMKLMYVWCIVVLGLLKVGARR